MEIGSVQKKIAGVMFLVLVMSLSFITYSTYRDKNAVFPPTINQCPDFYTLEGDTCSKPSVYPSDVPELNVGTNSVYHEKNANYLCKRKKWAKEHSVTWDGITNNDSIIPC